MIFFLSSFFFQKWFRSSCWKCSASSVFLSYWGSFCFQELHSLESWRICLSEFLCGRFYACLLCLFSWLVLVILCNYLEYKKKLIWFLEMVLWLTNEHIWETVPIFAYLRRSYLVRIIKSAHTRDCCFLCLGYLYNLAAGS